MARRSLSAKSLTRRPATYLPTRGPIVLAEGRFPLLSRMAYSAGPHDTDIELTWSILYGTIILTDVVLISSLKVELQGIHMTRIRLNASRPSRRTR